MQHHQRQSRLSQNTGPLSGAGAQILGGAFTSGSGPLGVESRITMNLEDVVLHEQKLNSILEVSISNLFKPFLELEKWHKCFSIMRGLVGSHWELRYPWNYCSQAHQRYLVETTDDSSLEIRNNFSRNCLVLSSSCKWVNNYWYKDWSQYILKESFALYSPELFGNCKIHLVKNSEQIAQ